MDLYTFVVTYEDDGTSYVHAATTEDELRRKFIQYVNDFAQARCEQGQAAYYGELLDMSTELTLDAALMCWNRTIQSADFDGDPHIWFPDPIQVEINCTVKVQ